MKQTSLSEKQLKELQAIIAREPGLKKQGKVGTFLDLWLVCEVLAKKLILYHKQLAELPIHWDYRQVRAALNSFTLSYDSQKVKPVFLSGNKGKRGSKTARQLRNGYIHSLSANDRKEIEDRYGELVSLLRYWKKRLSSPT